MPRRTRYARPPVFEVPVRPRFRLDGIVAERLRANTDQWLAIAPDANPSMLQILRDRDRTPPRDLVPWAGEFAGKYLTSAVGALRLTGDPVLRRYLRRFVADLIACQNPDGYFGPFPESNRMLGPGLWDLWGQYHVMLGLLRWHELTGDRAAWEAVRRCADHFCDTFLDTGVRVADAGWEEMNESSAHVFALLVARTGDARYRRMLAEIEKDWERPPSGDYVRAPLAGLPFWQTPKPRWESLHAVQAVAELALLTGDPRYAEAFDRTWWSIVEGDRHNTGGFSSGEQATGNPYDPHAIETCCTIAWMCVTLDHLRCFGDSRAADEWELSFWNGGLGAMAPSGRWWTYDTPMDGLRKASAHDIVFQARAGSPELNCCSVNGPRALAMLAEWAVMDAADGVVVNHYGPGQVGVRTPSGEPVSLTLEGDYPRSGTVRLVVDPATPESFVLRLRIPGWSQHTTVTVNGAPVEGARPGAYLAIERVWRKNDTLELELDFRPWRWVGEREAAGKVSVYRGPILLAYDPRFDTTEAGALPDLAASETLERVDDALPPGPEPWLRVRVPTADGGTLTLCDFASAGMAGNPYVSWLPFPQGVPAAFSKENPLRRVR